MRLGDGREFIEVRADGDGCDGCAGQSDGRLCAQLVFASGGCEGRIFRECGRYDGVDAGRFERETFESRQRARVELQRRRRCNYARW